MPRNDSQPRRISPHQRRILEFVAEERGHAVVQATAGSGKTTTLLEVARRLPVGKRACFLAFNRATAKELRARLPPHVEATTIHALGRRLLIERFPNLRTAKPEFAKYRALALEALSLTTIDPSSHFEVAGYLARLLGLMRLELTPPDDAGAVVALELRYNLDNPVTAAKHDELHGKLPTLLDRGREVAALGRFDLTDLVYLPVALGLQANYYFVCVDEAQDLSRLTFSFVQRLIAGGARALFVGDPHQAIYGFAGADERSLGHILSETKAVTLPLSVSYRCPVRHVLLARRFSPAMEAAPGAPRGRVKIITENRLSRYARRGDLVMSRVNAPLVALSLRLVKTGVPARVLGLEWVEELLRLARNLFPNRLPLNAPELTSLHGRRSALHIEQRLLSSQALARALSDDADRHHALAILLRQLRVGPGAFNHERLAELAHRLFGSAATTESKQEPNAVVLSTIHKAKGREAERAFLLHAEELAPHPVGLSTTPLDESAGINASDVTHDSVEANVLFVALTRSKYELVLVERRPGAIASRIRRSRAESGYSSNTAALAKRWTQVLSLARTMSRAPQR